MDEVVLGIALFMISGVFYYILRQLSTMREKQHTLDNRLGVEEAKGSARDGVSKEIKQLLKHIAEDLSTIKEEQGYWRGRQENKG